MSEAVVYYFDMTPPEGGFGTIFYGVLEHDFVEPAPVVGPQLQEVGTQIVIHNNQLPIDSMPVIAYNLDTTINRLVAQLSVPGADRAALQYKINLLVKAKGHIEEAGGGLQAARLGFATYLGDAAMGEAGRGFQF